MLSYEIQERIRTLDAVAARLRQVRVNALFRMPESNPDSFHGLLNPSQAKLRFPKLNVSLIKSY